MFTWTCSAAMLWSRTILLKLNLRLVCLARKVAFQGSDMEQNVVLVVTAAIIRRGDRFLIAKRSDKSRFPGRWEFPGGKVKEGETLRESLQREMFEEMGVKIRVGEEIGRTVQKQGGEQIILVAFDCEILSGDIRDIECDSHTWVTLDDALSFDLLEPDRELVLKMLKPTGDIGDQPKSVDPC